MKRLFLISLWFVWAFVAVYAIAYVALAPVLIIFNDSGNVPGPGKVALMVVGWMAPLILFAWMVTMAVMLGGEKRSPQKPLR